MPLEIDLCRDVEQDSAQRIIRSQETGLFETTRAYTAIDVYANFNDIPLKGAGMRIRVYAQSGGVEVCVFDRTIRQVTVGGRVARVRGGAAKYRVTASYTNGFYPATPLVAFGYMAFGSEPGPELGPDEGCLPHAPAYWRDSGMQIFTGTGPMAAGAGVAAPSYVRQFIGSSTVAVNTWVQLWSVSDTFTLYILLCEVNVSVLGQPFAMDFRDPHRLSYDNDGLWCATAPYYALSTTPGVYTANAGASITANWELRRLGA